MHTHTKKPQKISIDHDKSIVSNHQDELQVGFGRKMPLALFLSFTLSTLRQHQQKTAEGNRAYAVVQLE